MKIEAMGNYSRGSKDATSSLTLEFSKVQNHIISMIEKIYDLTIPKVSHEKVWCMGCMDEGNHASKCP